MDLFSLAAPLVGGLLGSKKQETTQTKTTDPRFDPYMYGSGGILPNAANWYGQNPTGMNDQMLTGMNNQWGQLGASKPGFDRMQGLGMDLMGAGIAGNPFTNGAMAGGGTPAASTGGQTASTVGSYQPTAFGGSGAFQMPKAATYAPSAASPSSGNLGFGTFQPGDTAGGGMGYGLGGGFTPEQLAANSERINGYLMDAYNSSYNPFNPNDVNSVLAMVNGLFGGGGDGGIGNDPAADRAFGDATAGWW